MNPSLQLFLDVFTERMNRRFDEMEARLDRCFSPPMMMEPRNALLVGTTTSAPAVALAPIYSTTIAASTDEPGPGTAVARTNSTDADDSMTVCVSNLTPVALQKHVVQDAVSSTAQEQRLAVVQIGNNAYANGIDLTSTVPNTLLHVDQGVATDSATDSYVPLDAVHKFVLPLPCVMPVSTPSSAAAHRASCIRLDPAAIKLQQHLPLDAFPADMHARRPCPDEGHACTNTRSALPDAAVCCAKHLLHGSGFDDGLDRGEVDLVEEPMGPARYCAICDLLVIEGMVSPDALWVFDKMPTRYKTLYPPHSDGVALFVPVSVVHEVPEVFEKLDKYMHISDLLCTTRVYSVLPLADKSIQRCLLPPSYRSWFVVQLGQLWPPPSCQYFRAMPAETVGIWNHKLVMIDWSLHVLIQKEWQQQFVGTFELAWHNDGLMVPKWLADTVMASLILCGEAITVPFCCAITTVLLLLELLQLKKNWQFAVCLEPTLGVTGNRFLAGFFIADLCCCVVRTECVHLASDINVHVLLIADELIHEQKRQAFHDATARWWCFSLLMVPTWLPSAWCHSGYQRKVLGILSRTNSIILAIWFHSNQYDVYYSPMNLMACMILNCLSCFCNIMIPEMQSVSYMVLALYIFRYHTNLQVAVPIFIVCISALYKLTGDCLISLGALLGSHFISFKAVVLVWAWGIWISVFFAQVDLISWCSDNSDLGRLMALNSLADRAAALRLYYGEPSTYPCAAVAGVERKTWPWSYCRSNCEETWNFQYCTWRKAKALHTESQSAMGSGGSQILYRLEGKLNFKEGRMLGITQGMGLELN